MTKRQKLQIEQSELRQKINALLGLDELTDEQRAEMEAHTTRSARHLSRSCALQSSSEGAEEAEARGQFGNKWRRRAVRNVSPVRSRMQRIADRLYGGRLEMRGRCNRGAGGRTQRKRLWGCRLDRGRSG